jgi:hypothetical protein
MTLHHYIRRKSHDNVTFIEFDFNFNFIPNNILSDIVTRSENHENYSFYRMNFIYNGIADS